MNKSGIYNEIVEDRTAPENQHGAFPKLMNDYFRRKFGYAFVSYEAAPEKPDERNLSRGLRHDLLMKDVSGKFVGIECVLHTEPSLGEAVKQLSRAEVTGVSELILVCPFQWTDGLQKYCEDEKIPLYTVERRGGRRTSR